MFSSMSVGLLYTSVLIPYKGKNKIKTVMMLGSELSVNLLSVITYAFL